METTYVDKSRVTIRPIYKPLAKDMIEKNHYSGRLSSCRYPLGVFYKTDNPHQFFDETEEKLIGVACYGFPVGRRVVGSIFKEEIIENKNVDITVRNHYSNEIGLYIYDFMSMENKLGAYGFHHIVSTVLLTYVIRNNLYNYGIYLLMIMNTSTPFLYLAKLTRNFKNKNLFIYTDSIFLMLFGYCRVYLLSDNLYLNLKAINTYNIYLRSLLGTMWGLQVLWFVKLNRMFFDQHMRRKVITNHSR